MREFSTVDQSQMQTRGEGVKKSQNFADVIYGLLLIQRLSYPTETALSNKITKDRIVPSFRDSLQKALRQRPYVSWDHITFHIGKTRSSSSSQACQANLVPRLTHEFDRRCERRGERSKKKYSSSFRKARSGIWLCNQNFMG